MTREDLAARLLVLEQTAQDLVAEIHLLFQDVLDSIELDEVE